MVVRWYLIVVNKFLPCAWHFASIAQQTGLGLVGIKYIQVTNYSCANCSKEVTGPGWSA